MCLFSIANFFRYISKYSFYTLNVDCVNKYSYIIGFNYSQLPHLRKELMRCNYV